jgi:hypothetical protein
MFYLCAYVVSYLKRTSKILKEKNTTKFILLSGKKLLQQKRQLFTCLKAILLSHLTIMLSLLITMLGALSVFQCFCIILYQLNIFHVHLSSL